jgi:hypothetical protein|tara:strand:- start:275 stop:436 length:162 start_codon:yes stop_codon:yes gene_type:complete
VQGVRKEVRHADFEEAFPKAEGYLSQAAGYIPHRFLNALRVLDSMFSSSSVST